MNVNNCSCELAGGPSEFKVTANTIHLQAMVNWLYKESRVERKKEHCSGQQNVQSVKLIDETLCPSCNRLSSICVTVDTMNNLLLLLDTFASSGIKMLPMSLSIRRFVERVTRESQEMCIDRQNKKNRHTDRQQQTCTSSIDIRMCSTPLSSYSAIVENPHEPSISPRGYLPHSPLLIS